MLYERVQLAWQIIITGNRQMKRNKFVTVVNTKKNNKSDVQDA
jgi:hypothetical protein